MKFRWSYAALLVCAAAVAVPVWRYNIGVERIVSDDEEMPVVWEWFVKHRKTWQYKFVNPARPVLEIEAYETLSAGEQVKLKEFCKVRYGVEDVDACYRVMCAPYHVEIKPGGWIPDNVCIRRYNDASRHELDVTKP
ncbi:hypothetical protein [Dyella japonica]|uniref:Uncharacterized protein n=1 Tax=Dyella japonica A8 TaxID=1217721 RepID=A0A075K6R0_9GAMM|nr:hypothetical protein [Dyella japonica]AIF47828.1 hypothetical protein HY57_11425 [Dyella japonica A8]